MTTQPMIHGDIGTKCCGAMWLYCGSQTSKATLRDFLTIHVPKWAPTKAVLNAIITEAERLQFEDTLVNFGFQRIWGPIKNPNTNHPLYGYILDVNEYRKRTSSPPQPSIFSKVTNIIINA